MVCPLCLNVKTKFYLSGADKYQQIYYQCQNCDLVFVTRKTRLSKNQEKQRYNNHNNDEVDVNYKKFLAKLAKPMLSFLKLNSKGLDFGSGDSETLANLFIANNHSCSSFDIFYRNNPKLLNQNYDFVSASEVVEHLNNPNKELKRLASLINRNGYLGIMTTKLVAKEQFANWWYKNDPTHICFYSNKTFNFIATWLSFEIIYNKETVIILKKV